MKVIIFYLHTSPLTSSSKTTGNPLESIMLIIIPFNSEVLKFRFKLRYLLILKFFSVNKKILKK